MDTKELLESHNKIKDDLNKQLDGLKTAEIRLLNVIENYAVKTQEIQNEHNKAKDSTAKASKRESEAERHVASAQRGMENARSLERTVEERLKQVQDDQVRLNKDWELVQKQREDLNNFNKELLIKERNVQMDERKTMNMRIQVDKIIEDNKIRKELGLD